MFLLLIHKSLDEMVFLYSLRFCGLLLTNASQRFTKEAILRQMQEYKREKTALEGRLSEMTKKTTHHDEHLMIIDSWFGQLIDEVKLLVGDLNNHAKHSKFPSALLSPDSSIFQSHLKNRSSEISSTLSQLFARAPSSSPEIGEHQARITSLLATEKEHLVELEKSRTERDKLEKRLEDAALRYMVAEKKLDRSKSATVAKLEKQAISGGRNETGSGLGGNAGETGGAGGEAVNAEEIAEVDAARRAAVAESTKRKEHLASLEAENEKLTKQLTDLTIRQSRLTDEDYSKTDLFKQLKSQHEDTIKRVNDLQATNLQLREEAEKLQAERTTYRIQLENEIEATVKAKELELAAAENDVARLRDSRDALADDQMRRKTAEAEERKSSGQVKELASANEERIKALEFEIERLREQLGQPSSPSSPLTSLDGLSTEEIQNRYTSLEKQSQSLNKELQSMGIAFKKSSSLASQKIGNLANLEEKVQRFSAEKVKADQKYFAAMKSKEARDTEVRALRAQTAKASEMVSSLKDSELSNRTLQVNLEKQYAEAKESVNTITIKLRTANQLLADRTILAEGLKSQVDDLKLSLTSRDESTTAKATACRAAETEAEKLKVRLETTKKQAEDWKARSQGSNSEEYEMYRSVAICTICHVNFKNTTIKTCGHVFCDGCVQERTALRSRKCPNCGKAFGLNDVMRITL